MRRVISKVTMSAALCAGLLGVFAAPAAAQDPKVATTGGIDFTNQYNFRGIRQNFGGMAIFPFVDVGIPVSSGDGALKSVSVNLGNWNSINTNQFGDAATDEPKWYESDLYATLSLGFNKTTVGFTYTAYTSPAENIGDTPVYFKTVHELAAKVAFDDSGALGKGALKPYGLIAFELGDGGADGIGEKGVYLELGVAPGYSTDKVSVAVPVKVGLSLKDYYSFGSGNDDKFGYFSVAGIVTVPVNSNWNVHGGVELQVFGDTLAAVNNFDSDARKWAPLGSIGVGFSF